MPYCPFYNLDCPGDNRCALWNTNNCIFRFDGAVYVNKKTMTGDEATCFGAASVALRDAIVFVEDNDMLFGDATEQTYPIGKDEGFRMTQVDISTLYFKNDKPGDNGTVHVLGVRA